MSSSEREFLKRVCRNAGKLDNRIGVSCCPPRRRANRRNLTTASRSPAPRKKAAKRSELRTGERPSKAIAIRKNTTIREERGNER
jgi:hypothetical protein